MQKKIICITLALFILLLSTPVSSFTLFGRGKKNVILIVPDGCSVAMWAAVRAMTVGIKDTLNVDRLPVQSRCRTYSANTIITDSAAAGTALACGVKTRNGVIGMNAVTVRGDSLSGRAAPSIIELAEKEGLATGIVTTSMVVHATPAAFYSHRAERDWYNLIAGDLVGAGIDVIMGGGRQHMLPGDTVDSENQPSMREDSRNVIDEFRREGYVYVQDQVGFDGVVPDETDKLLGLFNAGHMNYEYDRKNDVNGEPSLWEMTRKALDILSRRKKGFFLLVEAARIDHAAHEHDTIRWLWEGVACDKAVGVAKRFADENDDTLLIVVPDHGTGGPHFAGVYVYSGSDSTLATYEEAGFPRYTLDGNGFPLIDNGRPVAIQWIGSMAHTGEDVALHAMGPGSEDLTGLVNNTFVNLVMKQHLGLVKEKKGFKDISEIIDY